MKKGTFSLSFYENLRGKLLGHLYVFCIGCKFWHLRCKPDTQDNTSQLLRDKNLFPGTDDFLCMKMQWEAFTQRYAVIVHFQLVHFDFSSRNAHPFCIHMHILFVLWWGVSWIGSNGCSEECNLIKTQFHFDHFHPASTLEIFFFGQFRWCTVQAKGQQKNGACSPTIPWRKNW